MASRTAQQSNSQPWSARLAAVFNIQAGEIRTVGLLAAYAALLAVLALHVPLALRFLAVPAALLIAYECWRARPGYGRARRLPPGSLVPVPLFPVLDALAPRWVTTTERLGRAMLAVARKGAPTAVLENREIDRTGRDDGKR